MVTIPNLLTLLRLLLAPAVVVAILEGRHTLALACFGLAAVTDGLDGALARRFGWITTLGAYLDPLADKALLSGVYLSLAVAGILPWWFAGLVLGRDLLILLAASAAFSFTKLRKFPPSVWGKLSTFLQIVTAVTWMVQNVLAWSWSHALAEWMIWPTAAATIWSGIDYGWRGVRLWRTD